MGLVKRASGEGVYCLRKIAHKLIDLCQYVAGLIAVY